MVLERFYNPEKLLRSRLSKNPVYPFTVVEPNVYVLENTPNEYITACIICAVAAVVTVIFFIVGILYSLSLQYLIIPVLIFLFFMPQMFAIRGPRTLVIDFNQFTYEVCTVMICSLWVQWRS